MACSNVKTVNPYLAQGNKKTRVAPQKPDV